MSDPNVPAADSRGSDTKIFVLFGIVIALLAANVYLFLQLDQVRTDLTKTREALLTQISNLSETSSVNTQTSQRHLSTLREELEAARRQAAMGAGQAKVDAQKHADELARRLEAEQAKQQQAVRQELSKVEQAATATSARIGEVSSEVGGVKSEVAMNKAELDKTIADLKRTNGDLGVQSGLVATNGRELAALKSMGERNYFEFNLTKTKQAQKLADVTMLLKRVDTKKNKYTIELVADDKRVEKKDKNVNEPVQFYTSKYRQPYELVVNEVQKDRIIGYLSQPKVQAARN